MIIFIKIYGSLRGEKLVKCEKIFHKSSVDETGPSEQDHTNF